MTDHTVTFDVSCPCCENMLGITVDIQALVSPAPPENGAEPHEARCEDCDKALSPEFYPSERTICYNCDIKRVGAQFSRAPASTETERFSPLREFEAHMPKPKTNWVMVEGRPVLVIGDAKVKADEPESPPEGRPACGHAGDLFQLEPGVWACPFCHDRVKA